MSTIPIGANSIPYWPMPGRVDDQQEEQKPAKECPKSSKRWIRQACVEVIKNEKASVRQKLQAASILEKLARAKDLARADKRKLKSNKRVKSDTMCQIEDILERAGRSNPS